MHSVKESVESHLRDVQDHFIKDPSSQLATLLELATANHQNDPYSFRDDLKEALSAEYIDREQMHRWFHGLFNDNLGYSGWRAQPLLALHKEFYPNCDFRGEEYHLL